MKNLLFILLAISLVGCRAKKTVTEIENVTEKETIFQSNTKNITMPSNDYLLFNLKDSLGGLKDFIWTSKNGVLQTEIEVKNGQLRILKKNDSIIQKMDSINKNYEKKEIKIKNVIIEKVPFNFYVKLYSLIGLVIILLSYIIYTKFKK